MAKNWALVIGINQYDFLQPLNYAKRDAQLMQEFLCNEVSFEKILFFCDDSPDRDGRPTRPYRANLLRVLRQLFEDPFMQAGDNFWFFFSGHGIRHNERDYLMPCDGDPENIENTGIPINFITERLRRCGADNVVLILDACRSLGTRAGEGIGRQTQEMARTTGIISIFSCSPNEFSYEIDTLQQGAFTRALLEGLGIKGQCATVERLNQYLNFRVPELVSQHKKARQTPYMIAEPVNKSHLILVPKYATLADIATLKIDAYQAEVNKQLELAEQLWIRVLAAAFGQDMDAIRALQRIALILYYPPTWISAGRSLTEEGEGNSDPPTEYELQVFQFEVIRVNAQGREIERIKRNAQYFTETLGSNVTLEMVAIPSGTFLMGSPEDEAERENNESPLHEVTVLPFFMGKYSVTQAQWRTVAALPQVKLRLTPNPSHIQGDNLPVEQISWYEAIEFCNRLSKHTRRHYRLPSEAEWEYACRAGTTTPFHFGEKITPSFVNYRHGSRKTTPIGDFNVANAFGLYDIHGNVWEWCADNWHENYVGAPSDSSAWIDPDENNQQNSAMVMRGGSWYHLSPRCRSAGRSSGSPNSSFKDIGFRVVVSDPTNL